MTIYCKEVMVKFKDSKRPAEIIKLDDVADTAFISVIDEEDRLQIGYVSASPDGKQQLLKAIFYVLDGTTVAEWTCSKIDKDE